MESASFRWRRIAAFVLGISTAVVLLRVNPTLADPLAYAVAAVPLALWYYGLTTRSARSVLLRAGALAVGLLLAQLLRDAGLF